MSSSNCFEVLGEAPSSSQEQESRKPGTGTDGKEDQPMQDAGRAGSVISFGDLERSLPRVLSLQEGVELFRKKRAQIEAEDVENERKKKSRQGNGSSFVAPRTVPSAAPDSDDEMEELKAFDFRKVSSSNRRLKCMFRYQDVDENSTDPIGNIWSSEKKDWAVYLNVDVGRYGSAKV